MNDIENLDDIKLVVDTFYGSIREDELLKGIFNNIIGDKWPQHLEKMYRFWQTVLLDEHTYQGSPFPPHAKMDLQWLHFERWLLLFGATVDGLFTGNRADRAKLQAKKMAEMFNYKIDYYRNNPSSIPLA